jgi:glucose-1-phosphate thymidylyltransferase
MKGIVLAGGKGSRLHPLTLATSKQLLPVYDKPMIYYPLSTLMLAGIREISIITTPHEADQFKRLLGDGSQWGIRLEYLIQPSPNGIAEALIIGEEFAAGDSIALILGDNIFYGPGLGRQLQNVPVSGATIFAHESRNPEDYGVIELDAFGEVLSIEEKPDKPRSSKVVTGLYFYDNSAAQIAKELKPSARGELEITDLNNIYLERGELNVQILSDGIQWVDTGSVDNLMNAATFVKEVESKSGKRIAVPEEIAWRMGYISGEKLIFEAERCKNSGYGQYLLEIIKSS